MKLSLLPFLALLPLSLAIGPTYFYITKPAASDQWSQGAAHAVNWIHAQDDIDTIDIELARMSTSGLLFAAREVPTKWGSINVLLGNVPAGDDYYFIFLNVTHGAVYSISPQFSVLDTSASSANATTEVANDPTKPTVTVTGAPGPLQTFGATFGPQAAGALSIWSGMAEGRTTFIILSAIFTALLTGVMIVL